MLSVSVFHKVKARVAAFAWTMGTASTCEHEDRNCMCTDFRNRLNERLASDVGNHMCICN